MAFRRHRLIALALALTLSSANHDASAFQYIARRGDTLAGIALRFYGRVELEKVLVAANGLGGDVPLLPGMRVEIPAVSHHRIVHGDAWPALAERYLGDEKRAEALAMANDSMPWLSPPAGREIVVPFALRYVASAGDSGPAIAYRFLGKRDDAYVIDRFNELKGDPVRPGDVVLIPLVDLALTDEGRDAAKRGLDATLSEAAGDDRDAQERTSRELPALEHEVRTGEYLQAVARGNQLVGNFDLTDEETARIQRALLEAYAAMGHPKLAQAACDEWRRAAPDAVLDPVELSPKLMRACTEVASRARRGPLGEDALPATSSSASRSSPPGKQPSKPSPATEDP